MAQTQTLTVTVPDDFEVPSRLIQDALEVYLYEDDRWRLVSIEEN